MTTGDDSAECGLRELARSVSRVADGAIVDEGLKVRLIELTFELLDLSFAEPVASHRRKRRAA